MGVKFMREPCQKALQVRLVQALKQMQKVYLAEAQSHMRTPEGAKDLKEGEIKALATYISAEVIGGAWATMDEWGRGSLMDPNNPALMSYQQSSLWNPHRVDEAIRTREGPYTNIFGERKPGSKKGGINLEGKPGFEPWPPSHAMQTAMRWMRIGTIQKILRDAIATFPFHKYIIATKE